MSVFYSLAHRIGFTPWERAAMHPPAARHVEALLDREQREHHPPPGSALDLGCGSGHWSIALARRGWKVTGVELVAKAVRRAQERVRASGCDVRIIQGDITALRAAGVGEGFSLVCDFATIHGLTDQQRDAVARELDAVAAGGATMLLLAWSPGRRGPLPRGMSRADVERTFPNWELVEDEPFDATGLPPPLRSVSPRMYRLKYRERPRQ